jgi:hypothetical protein
MKLNIDFLLRTPPSYLNPEEAKLVVQELMGRREHAWSVFVAGLITFATSFSPFIALRFYKENFRVSES